MNLTTGIALAILLALGACASPNLPVGTSVETVHAKLACNVRHLCREDPEPEACFTVNFEHQLAVYYGNEKELYGEDYNTDDNDSLTERQAGLLSSDCAPSTF